MLGLSGALVQSISSGRPQDRRDIGARQWSGGRAHLQDELSYAAIMSCCCKNQRGSSERQ
jgi:hypothetical protein